MTRIIKTLAAAFIIGLTLLSLPLPASAQDAGGSTTAPIGTIIEIEGTASIIRQGQPLTAELDMPVFLNDVIETGAESKAHVLLIDDTEVTLGDNARFTVDEYIFDPDNNSTSKGRFSFLRGPFLFVSGLINKTENPDVELNTSYGSIGIRGTTVWGGTVDDEYGIFVQEGRVHFRNDRAQVNIGPGQGTFIRENMPTRPRDWSEEKIGRAIRSVALKRLEQVRQRVAARKKRHGLMRAHYRDAMKNRHQKLREKFQDLSPEQREQLKEKLQDMSPEQRGELRDRLQELRDMPPEEREELREKLEAMPAEEREELKERIRNQGPGRKEKIRKNIKRRKNRGGQ